jgi:hypothetical protein
MQLQAVIYSLATGRVRRWISTDAYPDAGAIMRIAGHVPGEGVLVVPGVADLHALQAAVNAVTGKVPGGDRHVMVDAHGNVTTVVHADPALDPPHPGHTMHQHEHAGPGWTLTDTGFVPPK